MRWEKPSVWQAACLGPAPWCQAPDSSAAVLSVSFLVEMEGRHLKVTRKDSDMQGVMTTIRVTPLKVSN